MTKRRADNLTPCDSSGRLRLDTQGEAAQTTALQASSSGKAIPTRIWAAAYSVGFFVLLFLYVWLWTDPSLLYHGGGLLSFVVSAPNTENQFPIFSWSWGFFNNFLTYPGGPIDYLSALLSQCYYYPWAGALILTAVAALFGLATNIFMMALAGTRVPLVPFIPGILVLVLCNQYIHRLAMLIGILVAMFAVCIYAGAAHRSRVLRFTAFLALSAPLYYLAGEAYLLYAALCGVYELRSKQGRLLGLCYLLFGGLISYAFATYGSDFNLVDTHAPLFPLQPVAHMGDQIVILGLYLFLLLAALVGALWRRMPCARFRNLQAKPGLELAILLIVAALAVRLSFDSTERTLLRINRFACQEMWPQVLEEARGFRCNRERYAVALHAVNRALYETGRLPYEMFSYPQDRLGFMLGWGRRSKRVDRTIIRIEPLEVARVEALDSFTTEHLYVLRYHLFFQLGDLTLQLGLVNKAEHEAHEALELLGDYPLIIKRLALINIAKGQTEAAKVFLRKLSTYPFYGGWGKDALRRLEADPLWSTDSQIEHIRSVMPVKDFRQNQSLPKGLDALLRRNKHNRMAFEYKMAFYLLSWQLEKSVRELDHLNDFNYPNIPRYYQEAIVLYEAISRRKVDLHGRQIDPQTSQTYQEFMRVFALFFNVGDLQGAEEVLGQHYGDTYFFYYFFAA